MRREHGSPCDVELALKNRAEAEDRTKNNLFAGQSRKEEGAIRGLGSVGPSEVYY